MVKKKEDFQAMYNPDPLSDQDELANQIPPNYQDDEPWVDKSKKKEYIESNGHSTLLYTKGKGSESKVHAFRSGIGDNDDLLVKKPNQEGANASFQYGVRLRGKKKHETMVYPEISFQYGIHYKGDLYTEDNEQEYEHRVDAYPGKSMEFTVTQEKPLPVEREWEAELTLSTMIPRKDYRYAVKWEGLYEVSTVQNAADLFTSKEGYFMGPGPNDVWKKDGTIVKEIDNRSHFSGIVAKSFYEWDNYEAEFDFKPIKATGLRNDPYARLISGGKIYSMPGADDDILGFIFRAKQENGKVNDFYIFLWEADTQVVSSWRPKSLNGYNVLTGNITPPYSHDKAEAQYAKYMTSCSLSDLGISNYYSGMQLTSTQLQRWNNYVKNNGWGTKHARVYRVTNGVMQEVHLTPKGPTTGWKQDWWNMNMMNSVKIRLTERRIKIYTQSYKIGDFDDNNYKLVYEFDVAPGFEKGSVGLATFSQAVEFHRIRVSYWEPMSGRIPKTGYSTTNHSGTITIANSAYDYVKNDAKSKAGNKPFEITSVIGEEDPATAGNGSISVSGVYGPIKVSTINPANAGQIEQVKLKKNGKVTINPDQKNPLTAKIVFGSINEVFGKVINQWLVQHPNYTIVSKTLNIIKPTKNDKDWDFEGETLKMWNSNPEIVITKKEFTEKVYAYEGWKKVAILKDEFDGNPWSTYRIEWREETVNPDYDAIELVGKWPDGYVRIKTTEWYEGVYPADISNTGIVTNQKDVLVPIPPMPEHYVEPKTREVMYHGHEDVHFLLTQIKPKTTNEVWMGFESSFDQYNTKITKSPINVINGKPIIKTDKINDRVRIHCDPKPRYEPWTSGKYIGYGKVNGKRPFFSKNKGKADMVNVPTDVVFIPEGLKNIQGPFIDVSDPRVTYRINPDRTVTFSSDYMDEYVWYTDWYSMWKICNQTYDVTSKEPITISSVIPIIINEKDQFESGITIEKIEAVSSNPFVEVWAEGSPNHMTNLPQHPYRFDLEMSIRYPSTEQIDLTNFMSEWVTFNEGLKEEDIGDWYGPPVMPKITNKRNQNLRSGWYNPKHADFSDYIFRFKVQSLSDWDDDMYGAIFRFDPVTFNHYSFEWDCGTTNGGTGIFGMAIYRNICKNREEYGINNLKFEREQLAYLNEEWGATKGLIHDVVIQVMGSNIQVFVDGVKKLECTDTSPKALKKGAWGPVTKSQPDTYFWDLSFTKYLTSGPHVHHISTKKYPPYSSKKENIEIPVWGSLSEEFSAEINDVIVSNPGLRLSDLFFEAKITHDQSQYSVFFSNNKDVYTSNIQEKIHASVPSFQLNEFTDYQIKAKIKDVYPTPWSPMIHNGYYYFQEKEHYLYANKIHHVKRLNVDIKNYETTISPRPQQGSPIIVRDKSGRVLRKVTFYDENWNLTFENKEVFSGNGHSKYYLSYKDIDPKSLKVKINDKEITDYIWNQEESSLQFMKTLGFKDTIEVTYCLLYSYILEMNDDVENDVAKIKIYPSHDPSLLDGLEIIYEASKDTPFYRAQEVVMNPILNHNHRGFLYITKQTVQHPKLVYIHVSPNRIGTSGLEKVLITGIIKDDRENPVPNKQVRIYRDGTEVYTGTTNEAGEVYFYDQPPVPESKVTHYKIECEGIENHCLLNFFVPNKPRRSFIEMKAGKSAILAGQNDIVTIECTLRDDDWYIMRGKEIVISYTDTHGNTVTQTKTTDHKGKVYLTLSGVSEKQGVILVKASYDMGEETTENMLYIKVIGG